jgi:FAD/FMN-containing dehydrogenase
MNQNHSSRRGFLKKITSLGVMGTVSYLHSPLLKASSATMIDGLSNSIAGKVIPQSDENYEVWRQSMIWHVSKPDRKPELIIQAKTEQDVIEAINFARENNKKVALRSSGHNSAGAALHEGGVLIDLSLLREINIDKDRQIATTQPGLWNTQLIELAGKEGLAFPAAHCPTVAMGGYLLGGGMGWNHAHWGGIACHSVRSMDIVTADGRKIQASPTMHKDLYWAARGAGPGFFGAVTKYELDLYQAPKTIMGSMYIHPLDNLKVVTDALEKLLEIKDERVEILLLFMHNHQAPADMPPEQAKICFVGINAFADSESKAKEMLRPFSESTLATESIFKVENNQTTFHKLYNPENVDTGRGRYAVDNDWTNDLSGALHALANHFKTSPSDRSHLLASLAIKPELRADASFSRIANHYIASYLVWNEAEDDDANHEWLRKTNELLRPFSEGHYVNEVAGDRYPERYEASFSKTNWARLKDVRKKYDPGSVFQSYLGHS